MWNDLRFDVRYAARALRGTPGFTATAVLTLALGIGANTAIFSVISGVFFRPGPYRDPSRLVFVWSTSPTFSREPLTPGRFVDFREGLSSASAMAGISHLPFNLTGGGEPERVPGSSVSSSFFDVLGVRPLLGDTFHAGSVHDRTVVLGYRLWNSRFGADRSIVGRTITLNGTARTVIGVMPREFDWPAVTATPGSFEGPQLWIPGTSRDIPRTPVDRDEDLAANRRAGYLRAVARLRDDVTLEQARREVELIAERLGRTYPADDGGRGATLVPLSDQFLGHVRKPGVLLLAGVGFVLAIACANVASLLLARSAARRRDIAVRFALGASRTRVIRHLLTESMLLALAGAVAGGGLAWAAQRWLATLASAGLPGAEHAAIDARVLLVTLALAVMTGLVCGLAPAWGTSLYGLQGTLAEGGARASGGRGPGRMRDALVVGEIAVALTLLTGAGLMIRSFHALSRVDTGIDTRDLLTFQMYLTGERAQYQRLQVAFYDEALRRISALPGIAAAGGAATLPIGGDDFAASFVVEGRPTPAPGQEPRAGYQVVTPGYFAAMRIPVLAGRNFDARDVRDAPAVAMVNETFARQQWPGGDAVGRRIRIGRADTGWMTVIGVVRDIRHLGPATPPRPEFYQPHSQNSFSFMAFVVRTAGPPSAMVLSVRAAIRSLDAAQPISAVGTMEEHVATALARPRVLSVLVGTFGGLALMLALVGVYGVMAYSVAQRTREIAIRAALGASPVRVTRMVLVRALQLAAAGITAGLALTLVGSRVLAGLLFQIAPTDPTTYALVALLLAIVCVLAAALPALRAARIDGATALRAN